MNVLKSGWFWIVVIVFVVWALSGGTPDKSTQTQQQAVQPQKPMPAPLPLTAKEKRAHEERNRAGAAMESRMLNMGYDVHVGIVGDNDKDNRHLAFSGEPVNRVFIYNILNSDFRRYLKSEGFTKITFTKSITPIIWVSEDDVATDTITAP